MSAAASPGLVPSTLAGRTLAVTQAGSSRVMTLVLRASGTFTKTPANNSNTGSSTGTYTFKRFSPVAGLLVLSFTDAADAGQTVYVQATFSSAAAGGYVSTSFDNTGALIDATGGRFTLR